MQYRKPYVKSNDTSIEIFRVDTGYFTKKKTIVQYVLCVLVMWVHIASLARYTDWPDWLWTFRDVIKCMTSVSVSLFMIISGTLFFRDYTNQLYFRKLKSRIFSLLIPMLCWNVINMVYYEGLVHLGLDSVSRPELIHSWKDLLLGIIWYNQYNEPMWFLSALFFSCLLAPVINFLIKNRIFGIITIFILTVLCSTDIFMIFPVFAYNRVWIIWYFVGAYIGKHGWDWFRIKNKRTTCYFSLALMTAMFLWRLLDVSSVFGEIIRYYVDVINLLTLSLFTWISFDLIIDRLKEHRFYKHSFWVFALHVNVNFAISKLTTFFLPHDWRAVLPDFIITTIGTLFVIEMVAGFVERFMPRVYKVLTGSR